MKKHALVVDDNPLVLAVVADLLEEMGLETCRKSSGNDAIALLAGDLRIDVVVTDVIMPDVSGVDVFRAARLRSERMPVVFVTGYSAGHLADIHSDDRTRIVSKPFSCGDLENAIRAVMA